MVSTLYLVRHGQTEGDATVKRYKGTIDVPLSDVGMQQSGELARYLKRVMGASVKSIQKSYLRIIHQHTETTFSTGPGTVIYSSNLSRAVDTAGIIAEEIKVKQVIVEPSFRERHFGIWEGMTFSEIREQYPDQFASWAGNPVKYSPPEGESTLEVARRVTGCLNEIIATNRGANIVLVAHGGVNRVLLCHLLGIPYDHIFRIEQDNASVNIIEFWPEYPVVKAMNIVPYCISRRGR